LLLPPFGATANQDNDLQSVLSKIDAQPRSPVDLVFTDTAKPLYVGAAG
jgi:predicted O-methyltransferase YrrM